MQSLPFYRTSMSTKVLFGLAAVLGFAAVSTAFAATGDAAVSESGATSGTYLSSLDVNGDVKVDATSSTSVTLSWDKVDAATSYVVFYDTKSPDPKDPNATYAKMTDPVSATGTTVAGLTPDTAYYLMVLAMDDKGNESSQGSKEVVAKTPGEVSFGLSDSAVTAVSATSLKLAFNKALDAGKPVSVSVVANQDKSTVAATAAVDTSDATKAVVTLASPLTEGTTYTVTVKLATSAAGENVQAGANAVQEFAYAAGSETAAAIPEAATASAAPEALSDAATTSAAPALNAAPAAPAKALPETGPAENLIVAMALVLGAVAVAVLRRRNA